MRSRTRLLPTQAVEQDEITPKLMLFRIVVRVEAENHFRPGVVTRYTLEIDRRLWLPVSVKEETPEGVLERTVAFCDLRVNVGLQDALFDLE